MKQIKEILTIQSQADYKSFGENAMKIGEELLSLERYGQASKQASKHTNIRDLVYLDFDENAIKIGEELLTLERYGHSFKHTNLRDLVYLDRRRLAN